MTGVYTLVGGALIGCIIAAILTERNERQVWGWLVICLVSILVGVLAGRGCF